MGSLGRRSIFTALKKWVDYQTPALLERGGVQAVFARGAATKKGKAAAAAVKKKSVVRKKTQKTASSGGLSHDLQLFKAMVDSCLDAPTPVRYLKEKDRLREMEREKLGLISKERQRELDMEKEKKKQAKQEQPVTDPREELDVVKLGVFEKDEIEIPSFELNVEEGRLLAKEYSRLLMKDLRKRQAEESMRLQLKNEAIAALPPRLREAALVPDLSPFPPNRHRAYLTPPIEGYDQKLKDAAKQLAGKKYR